MPTTRKGPLAAVAFLVLFFGLGVSTASAWSSRSVEFRGRFFAPRTRVFAHDGRFLPRSRAFFPRRHFIHRPFFAHRPFFRPFHVVRVFVDDPFPRWVYRRVYYGTPAYDPYCDPY